MLVPAVEADNVGVAEIINFGVPMGAENGVDVARCGKNGLCRKGKDDIAAEALATEKDASLVAALCADKVSVFLLSFACHYLPLLLPIGVGLTVEENEAFIGFYKLSEKMYFFHFMGIFS